MSEGTKDPFLPKGVDRLEQLSVDNAAIGADLPVGVRALTRSDSFTIIVPLGRRYAILSGFIAVLWMAPVVNEIIKSLGGVEALEPALLPYAMLGVLPLYMAFRHCFNSLHTTMKDGVLRIRHRPLPWLSPRSIHRDDIDQLFVERGRPQHVNGQEVVDYALKLKTTTGRVRTLALLENAAQARYLEREVERAFGIEDRRVIDTNR